MTCVPITGLNVKELLTMRRLDPIQYNYWLSRAVAKGNIEAKAERIIRKAQARLNG